MYVFYVCREVYKIHMFKILKLSISLPSFYRKIPQNVPHLSFSLRATFVPTLSLQSSYQVANDIQLAESIVNVPS